ncbi:MAG TPA: peptidylprolyl isomerase [Candidatus Acidoferrales bacterium]|nr:peptidylprolyl isomerase [Candidatus Acidoferrales bacterium]
MNSKSIFKAILLIAVSAGIARAQTKPVLDGIVAVVGNEIILKSELDYQVQLTAYQSKLDPNDSLLRKRVLEALVDDKLILAQAILDSVTVTDDEVTRQLDSRIQNLEKQLGSDQKVEEVYGMSINKIRSEFKDDMRKQLIVEKLKQQKFGDMKVSAVDVRNFYDTYKDSIPQVPEEVTLSHIFIVPKPSEKARDQAYSLAKSLLDSLRSGADFAALAKKYSQDPGSASSGGDLGWAKRGQFVPEFEHAVFDLKPSEISDIVETQFGFHIIQLLDRRGDQVHVRHILIQIPHLQSDDDSVIVLLDSLRAYAMAGVKFAVLAREFSQDKDTKDLGGDLGTLAIDQLEPSFLATVNKLKVGEISLPEKVTYGKSYGYHIVYLRNQIPPHKVSLDEDYDRLSNMALSMKQNQAYLNWINQLKSQIYLKIMS